MSSTPAPARTRKPAAQRRREIGSAARSIALGQGLSAVTLRSIAAEVGVAPALVAHYEPNMDVLVGETFAGIAEGELDEVRTVVDRDGPAAQKLAAVLAMLLDGARDDVTRVWVQAWGLGDGNPALAARVREQMDAWQRVLLDVLDGGVARGEFAPAATAPIARQLLGMIDGLNAHALVGWGEPAERLELMARAVEGMLGLDRGAIA